MKNGSLRFIPLQADLCLNKQKVDITDFNGWQKCNAPVYGDCLSPLYKRDETHHDIYIGDDNYDFLNGVLYKNGNTVLSGVGSKKLKKTKVTDSYSSMAVAEDNTLVYLKETSATSVAVKIGEDSVRNITISTAQRIVLTKCFANSEYGIFGCAILYLHTSGKYGYYLGWKTVSGGVSTWYVSDGTGSPTLFNNFDVTAPLIQVGIFSSTAFIVSIFGNSGANISSTQVRNVGVFNNVVDDGFTFYDSALSQVVRYNTIKKETTISCSVTNYEFWQVLGTQRWGFCQEFKFEWDGTVELDKIWVGGVSELDVKPVYIGNYLYLDADQKAAKYAKFRICYWGDSKTNFYHSFQSYANATAGWITRDEGSGLLTVESNTLGIFPCYKQGDVLDDTRMRVIYYYKTTSTPDDPTSAGTLVDGEFYSLSDHPTWKRSAQFAQVTTKNLQTTSWTGSIASYPAVQVAQTFADGTYVTGKGLSNITKLTLFQKNPTIGSFKWDTDPTWVMGTPSAYPATWKNEWGYNFTSTYRASIGAFYKEPFSAPAFKECDCVMDDGRLYCVGALPSTTDTPLPMKMLGFVGTYGSYDNHVVTYSSIASFNIAYEQNDEVNIYPKYWVGMSITLQDKFLKIIYKFKSKTSSTDIIYFLIDSTEVRSASGKNIYLYPGVQSGSDTNLQGSCYNFGQTEGWRLLFNTNMLSNIACFEKENYIGTILADWFSVDTDFYIACNSHTLFYRDNQKQIWRLDMVTQNEDWAYKLVENRYIILNTTNYFNCYDTQTGLKRHWASDYNNRIAYGYGFTQYAVNAQFESVLKAALFSGLIISGQNANYEQTQDSITSIELGALLYTECLKDYITFFSCDVPYGAIEGIDTYRGDGNSTSAIYICSYQNGLKYIDTDLTNPFAIYPIGQNADIRYNPNLYTVFITSYNNKDMVISDGVAYKLVYFNNVIPIMAYYLLDGVEGLVDAFVLQSTYYGVSPTRLYQMNYSNGVGVEVVADITNLEYLGALPTQALFWSAQNRAIYAFTGSCIMQLKQYANELTNIFGKWYNPATQELFLDTNIGLLVFSDLGTYCLEWETETAQKTIADIFFYPDKFLVNFVNNTNNTFYYSYNKLENYQSNGIKLLTKYYGNGLVPITVNNIYIRLYNQHTENAKGSITFTGHTITDIGTHTDTKTIQIGGIDDPTANPPEVAGEQWDTETNTMLVKYTPQYNRGLGFSLEVDTTFPIIDIKFDYVENGTIESQIAHINI